jgi:hypothetical protein
VTSSTNIGAGGRSTHKKSSLDETMGSDRPRGIVQLTFVASFRFPHFKRPGTGHTCACAATGRDRRAGRQAAASAQPYAAWALIPPFHNSRECSLARFVLDGQIYTRSLVSAADAGIGGDEQNRTSRIGLQSGSTITR